MKKYIINEKELKELLEDSWKLNDLYNAGVDNWVGMDYLDELSDEKEDISTEDFIKEHYVLLGESK